MANHSARFWQVLTGSPITAVETTEMNNRATDRRDVAQQSFQQATDVVVTERRRCW